MVKSSSPAVLPEYRYEKYALIQVAEWLKQQGYEHIRLSVDPTTIEHEFLSGKEIPTVTARDLADPEHRYRVYYDTPGYIDLVARKGKYTLLVEGKGIAKRSNVPGTIAQVIGQIVLRMKPSEPVLCYGIVLPDHPRYKEFLKDKVASDNPILGNKDFRIFLVRQDGNVHCTNLAELLASGELT